MREVFPGYYRPTNSQFKELWRSALFAIDANVLLNLYGYSSTTRTTLLNLFTSLGDRLWMPYQFADEFQRNRIKAIIEQVDGYKSVASKIEAVLKEHLIPKRRHPFITRKSMNALTTIKDELRQGQNQHEELLSDDPIFEEITRILTGRVGAAPTRQDLDTMHSDARRRYDSRIPPGFADRGKPEPERFGDYVGWRQILDHGTDQTCSLIFVTDDSKEDWWQVYRDRTIGPRPELIKEYMDTCDKPFYMYSLEQFTELAQNRFGSRLGSAALEEIRQRRKERFDALRLKLQQAKPLDELEDRAKRSRAIEKGAPDTPREADLNELEEPKADDA